MARRPKNPINDIVDTVGAWFGGRGPGTNPTVSRVSRDLGRAVSAADTVTGGFGAAALRDVKNFQQGGSLPTNLAKTAAVNLAAGAVGAKAAQVAGRAVEKVAESGVVGRAVNKMGDKTVLLHGSPTSGLRSIEPRVPPKGPNAGKGAKVYGMRTDTDPIKQKIWGPLHKPGKDLSSSIDASIGYARGTSSWLKPKTAPNQGSVYVIRTPRKTTDLSTELVERGITATGSTSRGKVVTEIQLGTKSQEQIVKEIQKGLRRAGVKVPKKK